jgi:nicotinate-nucleotide adenylyltransferase
MGGRIGIDERKARPRWGILGGIFDPIHHGHLAIAEQVRDALELAGVIFIPAGQPVHRDAPQTAADDRVRMVELAIADNPAFVLSRMEVDADRPSYTVDTLEQLTRERPGDDFAVIVSSEAASYLPTWSRPQRLLELAKVVIVPRLGYADIPREWIDHHFPGQAERFSFVETTRLGHSSSDVRNRVAAGQSIRYLVPPAVETYIGDSRLYGSDDRPAA